ncbi:MAG: hypothetical protein WCK89_13450, partial [bacterium]
CYEQYAEALKGALAKVPAGAVDLLTALLGKGLTVALVSRNNSAAVRAVFAGTQSEKLIILHEAVNAIRFCSWDCLLRAARKNDLHERLCVAVAGSGISVKGALISGLGVMVKVNPVTEYQDISGCDFHISEFSAGLADEVTRILRI